MMSSIWACSSLIQDEKWLEINVLFFFIPTLNLPSERSILAHEQYEENLKFEEASLCAAIECLRTDEVLCPVCKRWVIISYRQNLLQIPFNKMSFLCYGVNATTTFSLNYYYSWVTKQIILKNGPLVCLSNTVKLHLCLCWSLFGYDHYFLGLSQIDFSLLILLNNLWWTGTSASKNV